MYKYIKKSYYLQDLRVFSLFQVEVKQPYLIKKFSYNQSSKEWELYGDLALRLGYKV